MVEVTTTVVSSTTSLKTQLDTNMGDLLVANTNAQPSTGVSIGNFQLLEAGANGYVLTSNGPGELPSWEAGGSGTVSSVVAGTGIEVDDTDPANPVVGLDTASQAALASLPTIQVVTGSDYTNATTSSTNVFTGITTEANAVYLIEYNLRMSNSAAAASSQLQITAPASSTVTGGHLNGSGPFGLVVISGINTLQAVSTATTASNAAAKAASLGIVVTTSATTGTLTLGAAAVSGTTTINTGSWIRITKLS